MDNKNRPRDNCATKTPESNAESLESIENPLVSPPSFIDRVLDSYVAHQDRTPRDRFGKRTTLGLVLLIGMLVEVILAIGQAVSAILKGKFWGK